MIQFIDEIDEYNADIIDFNLIKLILLRVVFWRAIANTLIAQLPVCQCVSV